MESGLEFMAAMVAFETKFKETQSDPTEANIKECAERLKRFDQARVQLDEAIDKLVLVPEVKLTQSVAKTTRALQIQVAELRLQVLYSKKTHEYIDHSIWPPCAS